MGEVSRAGGPRRDLSSRHLQRLDEIQLAVTPGRENRLAAKGHQRDADDDEVFLVLPKAPMEMFPYCSSPPCYPALEKSRGKR